MRKQKTKLENIQHLQQLMNGAYQTLATVQTEARKKHKPVYLGTLVKEVCKVDGYDNWDTSIKDVLFWMSRILSETWSLFEKPVEACEGSLA